MKPTDQLIQKITLSFEGLDFSQPKAHEVYRELLNALNNIVCDSDNLPWHEFYYYSLGVAYGKAEQQFMTIPPISSLNESQEKEGQ